MLSKAPVYFVNPVSRGQQRVTTDGLDKKIFFILLHFFSNKCRYNQQIIAHADIELKMQSCVAHALTARLTALISLLWKLRLYALR